MTRLTDEVRDLVLCFEHNDGTIRIAPDWEGVGVTPKRGPSSLKRCASSCSQP